MRFSSRTRHALCLMIELAANADSGFMSLKEISWRDNVSLKYMEQIMSSLKKAGLIVSTRGARGGYRLARLPRLITAGDIIRVTEGTFSTGADEPDVNEVGCSVTAAFFDDLQQILEHYLDSVSLEKLREAADRNLSEPEYSI